MPGLVYHKNPRYYFPIDHDIICTASVHVVPMNLVVYIKEYIR